MSENSIRSSDELALVPGGSNWVYGDRFFDRDAEIEALRERVENGTHTLLTGQRRMGKTSLVRELLRRLDDEGQFATVFVDLEAAMNGADAVAEMAIQAQSVQSIWRRIQTWSANRLGDLRDNVEEVGVSELKVRLRAGMDAGNWQRDGDRFFAALAANERPVVLAIDELSILVNRLLKGHDYRITPERREATDRFMSWLRRNCQAHPGRICLIVSGQRWAGAHSQTGRPQHSGQRFCALGLAALESGDLNGVPGCIGPRARGKPFRRGARRNVPSPALFCPPSRPAVFPSPAPTFGQKRRKRAGRGRCGAGVRARTAQRAGTD